LKEKSGQNKNQTRLAVLHKGQILMFLLCGGGFAEMFFQKIEKTSRLAVLKVLLKMMIKQRHLGQFFGIVSGHKGAQQKPAGEKD